MDSMRGQARGGGSWLEKHPDGVGYRRSQRVEPTRVSRRAFSIVCGTGNWFVEQEWQVNASDFVVYIWNRSS